MAADQHGRTFRQVQGLRGGVTAPKSPHHLTLDELYDYVHARLTSLGNQTPQRRADGEGTLPIARHAAQPLVDERSCPAFRLSRTVIVVDDVTPGEHLPPEPVRVLASLSHQLDWMASTDVGWIRLARTGDRLDIYLTAPLGNARANVEVFDRTSGEAYIIRVVSHARIIARSPYPVTIREDTAGPGSPNSALPLAVQPRLRSEGRIYGRSTVSDSAVQRRRSPIHSRDRRLTTSIGLCAVAAVWVMASLGLVYATDQFYGGKGFLVGAAFFFVAGAITFVFGWFWPYTRRALRNKTALLVAVIVVFLLASVVGVVVVLLFIVVGPLRRRIPSPKTVVPLVIGIASAIYSCGFFITILSVEAGAYDGSNDYIYWSIAATAAQIVAAVLVGYLGTIVKQSRRPGD
jgi:hypothetical protein